MIPRELLATATVPGQSDELKLYRHDGDYFLHVRGTELMSSRVHGSEEQLAELALERLRDRKAVRVLIGGLGMGFTLARVASLLDDDAELVVVELVPEIAEWNHRWFGECNGHPLRDKRVTLIEGDVVPQVRRAKAEYDAILLDVDNGPDALTRDSNRSLYSINGLHAARIALRPGGVLAVWSSTQSQWFGERMRGVGYDVREQRVRARRDKGPRHTIWLGTRP